MKYYIANNDIPCTRDELIKIAESHNCSLIVFETTESSISSEFRYATLGSDKGVIGRIEYET